MQCSQNFQADFCPKCGTLTELDTLFSQITCSNCKNKIPFTEFVGEHTKTFLKVKKDKQWIKKYTSDKVQKEKRGKTKMTIKQNCPKCDNPELKYYTVQTRSADEGSTVFYECEKCSHSFSVNN